MADKPMSQEDIDALLAGMDGPTSPVEPAPDAAAAIPTGPLGQADLDALLLQLDKSTEPVPVPEVTKSVRKDPPAGGPLDQADLDALMGVLGGAQPPAAQAPVPTASAPSAAASAKASQDEIDALLNSMGGTPEPTPKPAAVAAKPSTGPMGQDEIDALLNSMGGAPAPAPTVKAPAGPMGQDEIDALLKNMGGTPEPAKPSASTPAVAAGSMGQDEIDALLNSMGGTPEPAKKPVAEAKAPAGPMGQDEIDALLNSMGGTPEPIKKSAVPGASMGQDEIDALINGMGGSTAAPAPAPAPSAPGAAMGQSDIDALLASLGADTGLSAPGSKAPAKPPTVAAPTPKPAASTTAAAQMGQEDIDALLNSLGGDPVTSTSAPNAQTPTMEPGRSLSLTTEDLDALVNKHDQDPGSESEAMIDQGDIDALVRQLASVTGEEAAKGLSDLGTMTEQLARHDEDIDRILGEANAKPQPTWSMDTVDPKGILDKPHSSIAERRTGSTHTVIATTQGLEFKGARWLLAAAVLLLAVCAGTLVTVATLVRGLALELKAERVAQLAPTESYSEDFKAALSRLASKDDDEVAKGVLFLQRLKVRYPSHESEIGLVLARHFRSHAAWREAAREYGLLAGDGSTTHDDPRVHLEYADVLARIHEREAALRQVHFLLANEAFYTGPVDRQELPRPARELADHRQAVQEARLLLGRLLTEDAQAEAPIARREPRAHAGPAHGEAAVPEEVHGEIASEAGAAQHPAPAKGH